MNEDDIIKAASAFSDAIQAVSVGIGGPNEQQRAYKYNMQLQHDAQNWNSQMWDKANEYNSPVQQMARLSEAGLNPNLIYGQPSTGSAGIAHAASSPLNSTGNLTPFSLPVGEAINRTFNTINAHHQSKLIDANAAAAHAQSLSNIADAAHKLSELPGTRATSKMLSDRAAKYGSILELEMENTASSNAVNRANAMYIEHQAEEVRYRYENLLPAQKQHYEAMVDQAYEYVKQGWANVESNRISAIAAKSQAAAANTNAAAYQSRVDHENAIDKEVWQRKHFENYLLKHGIHPDLANSTARLMFSAQFLGASMRDGGYNPFDGLNKHNPLTGTNYTTSYQIVTPTHLNNYLKSGNKSRLTLYK